MKKTIQIVLYYFIFFFFHFKMFSPIIVYFGIQINLKFWHRKEMFVFFFDYIHLK